MTWYWIVLIAYFGVNLILAILAVLIGFGLGDAKELIKLFFNVLLVGFPVLIFQMGVEIVSKYIIEID